MQSFRSNNNNASNAVESKRSFGIFGSMIRKSKTESTPSPPSTPPKLELQLPPLTLPPINDAPKEAPRPRKVTKKASTDVDDELRKHLQREGFAFLAFTDPEKVAASRTPPTPSTSKPIVVDPVESSRRGGTLLKDAVERLEKTSVEASRPMAANEAKTPLRLNPAVNSIYSFAEPPKPIPEQQPPNPKPLAFTKQKPVDHTSPIVSPFVTPVETSTPPINVGDKAAFPVASTVAIVGYSSGIQTAASKPEGKVQRLTETQPPCSSAETFVPNGHLQARDGRIEQKNFHRRTDRGTWNKSPTDSGKDLRMDNQNQSGVEGFSAMNGPLRSDRIPESTAMARFAQEASMHDVDPRRSSRNPGNNIQHPQSRRAPPPDMKQYSGHGNGVPASRPAQGGRPRSREGPQRPGHLSTNVDSRALRSPVDEAKNCSESSLEGSESLQAFKLPVPVMLSPDDYKTCPNELQRNCPVHHCSTVMFSNIHHRICCMVCQSDSADERWLCSYCALRFCSRCKSEFFQGKTLDQILAKAEADDWKSLSSCPPSPVRTSPERNIPWELACVMEAGGRFHGPRVRSPPQGRRPPPQMRRVSPGEQGGFRSGKSSPHSYSPDEQVPSIYNQPPSPSSSDREKARSRNGNWNGRRSKPSSMYEDAPTGFEREARRKAVEKIMGNGRKTPAARCSTGPMNGGGSAVEQRRALLGGIPY